MENEHYTPEKTATDTETNIFEEVKPLPVYYSEKAITVFSILFGVYYGSILLAMNLNNTEGKKGKWEVIIFGVLYSIAQLSILNLLPGRGNGLAFVFNIVGAYILRVAFWPKYIGKDVNYRKRSIVTPAIIAIVICVVLLVLALLPSWLK